MHYNENSGVIMVINITFMNYLYKFACMKIVNHLLRFAIDKVDLDSSSPKIIGLQLLKHCSKHRIHADSWSKIVFQYMARTEPLTIETILCEELL